MADVSTRCTEILARFRTGVISSATAVMEMLIACENVDEVMRIVDAAQVEPLAALLRENKEGCARIADMLASGVDSSEPARSSEEGIAFCRRLFDWSVQQSEEASVALYSLGSPEILAKATDEIVQLLDTWRVIHRDASVLQIGCGIGRFERALSPRVAEAHGIDVSPKMIEAAERRCAGLTNVKLAVCSGNDLGAFPDARFDLVYAVDSFPYLVQSGMDLVRKHFHEAARVLRPRGDFVLLNFSYRGPEVDRADVRALADQAGFDLLVCGALPFALWDGLAFHLRAR